MTTAVVGACVTLSVTFMFVRVPMHLASVWMLIPAVILSVYIIALNSEYSAFLHSFIVRDLRLVPHFSESALRYGFASAHDIQKVIAILLFGLFAPVVLASWVFLATAGIVAVLALLHRKATRLLPLALPDEDGFIAYPWWRWLIYSPNPYVRWMSVFGILGLINDLMKPWFVVGFAVSDGLIMIGLLMLLLYYVRHYNRFRRIYRAL